MIKTAEIEQAYIQGRYAAMEKLAADQRGIDPATGIGVTAGTAALGAGLLSRGLGRGAARSLGAAGKAGLLGAGLATGYTALKGRDPDATNAALTGAGVSALGLGGLELAKRQAAKNVPGAFARGVTKVVQPGLGKNIMRAGKLGLGTAALMYGLNKYRNS